MAEPNVLVCPMCAEDISASDVTCPHCGSTTGIRPQPGKPPSSRLSATAPQFPPQVPASRSRRRIFIGIAAGLVALSAATLGVILFKRAHAAQELANRMSVSVGNWKLTVSPATVCSLRDKDGSDRTVEFVVHGDGRSQTLAATPGDGGFATIRLPSSVGGPLLPGKYDWRATVAGTEVTSGSFTITRDGTGMSANPVSFAPNPPPGNWQASAGASVAIQVRAIRPSPKFRLAVDVMQPNGEQVKAEIVASDGVAGVDYPDDFPGGTVPGQYTWTAKIDGKPVASSSFAYAADGAVSVERPRANASPEAAPTPAPALTPTERVVAEFDKWIGNSLGGHSYARCWSDGTDGEKIMRVCTLKGLDGDPRVAVEYDPRTGASDAAALFLSPSILQDPDSQELIEDYLTKVAPAIATTATISRIGDGIPILGGSMRLCFAGKMPVGRGYEEHYGDQTVTGECDQSGPSFYIWVRPPMRASARARETATATPPAQQPNPGPTVTPIGPVVTPIEPAASAAQPSCSVSSLDCGQYSPQGQTGRKLHDLVFAADQGGRYAEALCLTQPNLNSPDTWLAGAANFEASRAWEGLGCHNQAVAAIDASLAVRPRNQGGWKETCDWCTKIGGTCAQCGDAGTAIAPSTAPPPPTIAAATSSAAQPPPSAARPPVDAATPTAVHVLLVSKDHILFDAYENGVEVLHGGNTIDVVPGSPRLVTIKAKPPGYKDKTITIDGASPRIDISLDPVTSDCSATFDPSANAACRAQYCASHKDDPRCPE